MKLGHTVVEPPPLSQRPDEVNVAMVVDCTEAEGPGKRFALWVQGCPMRCPGCCNPEMLPFEDNQWTSIDELADQVASAKQEHGIVGVTFLGGEPFTQAASLSRLAERVRAMGLTVMVFSGFRQEALAASPDDDVSALLASIDLLVDGPFDRERLDRERRWIGSQNQRAFALTGQYAELVADWDTSPDTLEIRIVDGQLRVNGSPFLLDKLGRLRHL